MCDFIVSLSRWYEGITEPFSHLQIDTIYFDNTYSRKSAKFITRQECKEEAVALCAARLNLGKIVFFVLDPVGKEDIMSHVAETLGIKVVVSEEKMKILSCMKLDQHFTVCKEEGLVFYVAKNKLNYKRSISKIAGEHAPKEVTFVKISGMRRGQNCLSYEYINFSDHSSMKEIEVFFDDLKYTSATPIVPRIEKEPSTPASPTKSKEEIRGRKRKTKAEALKVKLRKVIQDANTPIGSSGVNSMVASPEPSVSTTPTYRVVTAVTTDEEAGDSPAENTFSPPFLNPFSSGNVNDDEAQMLAVHLDYNTADNCSTDVNGSYAASSPVRPPYIEPPICLDWLPSPIKTTDQRANLISNIHPILKFDEEIINVLSSSGSSTASFGFNNPSPGYNSSVEMIGDPLACSERKSFSSPTSDFKRSHSLSPCDLEMICNSPVYDIDGRVRYVSNSPIIEREGNSMMDSSDSNFLLGSYKPKLGQLYEEMFRESEIPPQQQSCNSSVDFDDGIDVLNETQDSVETLYVSDTESESEEEGENAGPIGDYLRGQYAINQIFNNSVLNIRDSFANSEISKNMNEQLNKRRKSTEEDLSLATTRLELLLPKVNHQPNTIEKEHDEKYQPETTTKSFFDLSNSFVQCKENYLRNITEISERGRKISYKKPMKIGKWSPEAKTKTLLYDSINLTNNYAESFDEDLKALTWKLNYDDTFIPKSHPVLIIPKKPLPSYLALSFPPKPRLSSVTIIQSSTVLSTPSPKQKSTPNSIPTPVHTKFVPSPKELKFDVSPASPKFASAAVPSECFMVSSPTTLLTSLCLPRAQSTPKPGKSTKNKSKQLTGASSRARKSSTSSRASPASAVSNNPTSENIFEVLFGSTPTSAISKKRIGKIKKKSNDTPKRLTTSSAKREQNQFF